MSAKQNSISLPDYGRCSFCYEFRCTKRKCRKKNKERVKRLKIRNNLRSPLVDTQTKFRYYDKKERRKL